MSLARALAAEALGTAFLLLAVVGSGIMAERLCGGNTGLILLALVGGLRVWGSFGGEGALFDALAVLAFLQAMGLILNSLPVPGLDGFGVIEGVRADPAHRATPILVLTTESDAAKKERARSAGATGWIVKPFNPVKLVDAVRRVAA